MTSPNNRFSWHHEVDFNGNEFYHPDLGLVSNFMEMICNGQIPQLEWSSPGRRLCSQPSVITTAKTIEHSSTLQVSPSVGQISSNRTVSTPSTYDFDDSESFLASSSSSFAFNSAISPAKAVESRKRIGTLNNALQSMQQQTDKPRPLDGSPRIPQSPSREPRQEPKTENRSTPNAAVPSSPARSSSFSSAPSPSQPIKLPDATTAGPIVKPEESGTTPGK